jgi:hypothetical protein
MDDSLAQRCNCPFYQRALEPLMISFRTATVSREVRHRYRWAVHRLWRIRASGRSRSLAISVFL